MKTIITFAALLSFASLAHASNVNVKVGSGSLVVVGDAGDNFLQISGEGDVLVQGFDGTTINNESQATFAGVKSININLQAGSDKLILDSVKISGPLKIALGAGQDAVTIKGVECKSIDGTCGYFPGSQGNVPSGINATAESFYFTDVHVADNISITSRGLIRMNDVSSDGIVALLNASGITGIGRDNSVTNIEGLKSEQLFCTFGRGDDRCQLTNSQATQRFIIAGNFGDDTLVKENFTSGESLVMQVEHNITQDSPAQETEQAPPEQPEKPN
jgi:hypothetical protein